MFFVIHKKILFPLKHFPSFFRWHFLVPTAAEPNVDGIGPRMGGGGGGEGVPMEEFTAEDLGITVYSEGDREEMCSQEAVVGKRGSARPPRVRKNSAMNFPTSM